MPIELEECCQKSKFQPLPSPAAQFYQVTLFGANLHVMISMFYRLEWIPSCHAYLVWLFQNLEFCFVASGSLWSERKSDPGSLFFSPKSDPETWLCLFVVVCLWHCMLLTHMKSIHTMHISTEFCLTCLIPPCFIFLWVPKKLPQEDNNTKHPFFLFFVVAEKTP